MQNSAQNTPNTPHFEIQRVYVKDLSFEAPNTPHTFVEDWKPEVQLNLETKSNRIQDNAHEVVLSVTAAVTTSKKSAFVVEVHLAGVFQITGVPADQMRQMLGSFCPNILFPYAREVISDVVVRGGFPQLILAPVNFDALYAQHLEDQEKQGGKTESDSSEGKVH
ncbi:MAG: preprotein translocase subunit SecB [uncultured bacterium]|nr:MAG: preprotein translocase subunit SecB [uncultured bacterium]